MTRKILAVILALAMVFALALTACGGETAETDTTKADTSKAADTTKAKDSEAAPEEPGEIETIDYYLGKNLATNEDWVNIVAPALNDYAAEKIGITCEWHCFGSEYNDRLNSALSAGIDCDIFFVSNSTTPFMTWYQRNALAPLKELLETYSPGFYAACPDYYWVSTTIDDEIWGMPSVNGTATDIGFYYNDTMLEKYGLMEEFEAIDYKNAEDFNDFFYDVQTARAENDPDKTEPALVRLGSFLWVYMKADKMSEGVYTCIPGTGAFEGYKTDNVFNLYETPEYNGMMTMINTWVNDNIFPYDANNFDTENYYYNNGYELGKWAWGNVSVEIGKYDEFGWTEGLRHNANTFTYTLQAHGGLTCLSAQTTDEKRVASMKFWELFSEDPEASTMLHCGVEGVHWERLEKDGITIANFDFEGGRNSNPTEIAYFQWFFAEAGDLFTCYLPSNQPTTFFDDLTAMNNRAVVSENMGFLFNNSSVENEVAAVANVIGQYQNDLIYGMIDDVNGQIDKFCADLEANGMQTVIDECQAQLTEWRS